MTVNLDGLVFPKLLPGHKWVVNRATDSFSSWDQIEIEIRKDRRYFTYLGFSRNVWLTRAAKQLSEAGWDVPATEQEQWRLLVIKHAESLHDTYKERLRIPIQAAKVRDAVMMWEDELNEHLHRH